VLCGIEDRRQMIKAYLINLDRSPGRLEFMQAQFDALGLAVERVSGVDGSAIDLTPYQGSRLTPGEVGCFLSHRAIWQKLVDSSEERALVMEDDVRLSDALPGLLVGTDWIPPGAGVVKLDTSGKRIGVRKLAAPAPGGRTLRPMRTVHMGAAGYILSRDFAATLIERSVVLPEAVDRFMFGNQATARDDGRLWQLVPAVVGQEKRFNAEAPELQSLIRHERRSKRSRLERLPRNIVRPFRNLVDLATRPFRMAFNDIRYLRVPFR